MTSRLMVGALLCIFSVSCALAEFETHTVKTAKGNIQRVWPKLAGIKGWKQDTGESTRHNINALAPEGQKFAKAATFIYAAAEPTARHNNESLESFINLDKQDRIKHDPSIQIKEGEGITTAGGLSLRMVDFIPKAGGRRERVYYGTEKAYFVVFVLSGKPAASFEAVSASFDQMVKKYK